MYDKIEAGQYGVKSESEVLEFWKKNGIIEKAIDKNDGTGKEFTFYDGPPTANGKPHVGHILTRVIKDIIPRYKTMKGFHCHRKAGWDTHGLPVELEVEKTLGIDGKQEIEKYGVEKFIGKCKESVWKYKGEWEKMSDRVAYWADMDNPYVTYSDNYIESEWWALKTIWDKGLLYRGYKIVPYCPRCGTSLSSHEVAQGYKDVEEKSAIAKFKIKGEDKYFLAWTTTPWTLPGNVALCMGADYDYVTIAADGEKYVLAEALAGRYFENYTVLETRKGKDYEGTEYEPLYPADLKGKKGYYVVNDGYVTLDDGTGIVHIAPAFGEDDNRVGKNYDLPYVQHVDDRGRMCPGAPFEGMFCKDADKSILKDLKQRNLLFKELMYKHSYPFCWRCDTPLLYYARSTWFIKMTAVKDKLLSNNASVNWIPPSIGTGRMGNFLENVIDWGLSRERYWGTPLPVWICPDCGEIHVVGSKAELKKLAGIEGDIELHKPYVDNVTFRCEKCGGTMKRTPEVIDCWFDSGSMPFAQLHYPFENRELFEKRFPADFISEAVDQTRGWFYTLLAISTLLFDKAPFKNCIVLGHVNDKNGIKMSKHKGNVVDPWSILDVQGADAVRWYFYTGSAPWIPSRFYAEAVSEAQRKFLGTLWNVYSFYVLYADIDEFNPANYSLDRCRFTMMDRWILSEVNTLAAYVDAQLGDYKITESARAIADFTDKLSNWYVRRSRERFWGKGMDEDKTAAYMTLYTALRKLIGIAAPFVPFITETVYQNIVRKIDGSAPLSVHLTDFPTCDKKYVDKKLEAGMEEVLKVAVLGRAARNQANIKNRQPLGELLIVGGAPIGDELLSVIADELNVKKVAYAADAEEYVSYEVKPQLKTLGPKYGRKLGAIKALMASDAARIVESTRNGGVYTAEIEGETVSLTAEDLLIFVKNKEGFVAQSDYGVTVILETEITPELEAEGYAREIISRVQNMRKDSGFEVTDHITLAVSGDAEIEAAVEKFGKTIASVTLADSIVPAPDDAAECDINGKKARIAVIKVC